MSFLSRLWNWSTQVTEKNFEGHPLFYRVVQNSKEILIPQATLRFEQREDELLMRFVAVAKGPIDEFFASVHPAMSVHTFVASGESGRRFCIEWTPERAQMTYDGLRFGCEFADATEAENFGAILVNLTNGMNEGRETHLRKLTQAPQYMEVEFEPDSARIRAQINEVLLEQAQSEDTKMANSCALYAVKIGRTSLLLEHAVFAIHATAPFRYAFCVLDEQGRVFVEHAITPTFSYELNLPKGELKWVDTSTKPVSVYRVAFDKYEVAINVQFAFAECLYEGNTKRKLRSAIEEQ